LIEKKKHKTRPPELRGLQLKEANILISWNLDYLVKGVKCSIEYMG
jgi:hypothetical protein